MRKERTIFNESHAKLYRTWRNMKARCENPSFHSYPSYGGVGVSICDEWSNSFVAFRDWAMANGYIIGLTIDRKRSNEGYSPNNCQWLTRADNCAKPRRKYNTK